MLLCPSRSCATFGCTPEMSSWVAWVWRRSWKRTRGNIATWSYDKDGDFTHVPEQWKNKAWLRPATSSGKLLLNIIPAKGQNMASEVYAVYHGRFIEAMLVHCDTLFSEAYASALPASGDNIKGS